MAKNKSTGSRKDLGKLVIANNKRARFDYEIIENFEAGLVLTGSEIKSIRLGGISINEAYVRPKNDELWLLGCHIKEYAFSQDSGYDPIKPRKLLMHKREINKLRGRVEQKGLTIVPLQVYLKRGRAKLEIGLARGKNAPDKRHSLMDRERKRDAERAMKRG